MPPPGDAEDELPYAHDARAVQSPSMVGPTSSVMMYQLIGNARKGVQKLQSNKTLFDVTKNPVAARHGVTYTTVGYKF